jgi:transcriptional regulator with XRE-family HTH domain
MLTQLKIYRLKLGLRQVDLAERAELPQHRISLLERGVTPVKDEAQSLANVLGTQVEILFPGFQS